LLFAATKSGKYHMLAFAHEPFPGGSCTPKKSARTSVILQAIRRTTNPAMKKDISREVELNNPALGNLAQGLPNAIAAWAYPPIMPAPIKKNGNGPLERPVAFPEQAMIDYKTEVRVAFEREQEGPSPASAFFDRHPGGKFDRRLVAYVNVTHPAVRLGKRSVGGLKFFVAVALIQRLHEDLSPLAEALLAELKILGGLAPNQPVSTVSLARRVAQSELLQGITRLPLGKTFETLIGRTFPLGVLEAKVARVEWGPPWHRSL
jgi:hypothetical protein